MPCQGSPAPARGSRNIGVYLSRHVSRAEQQGDLVAVVCDAQFGNEEHAIRRLVLDQALKASGLWFDSPRLRQG